jgi:hypothetical protein
MKYLLIYNTQEEYNAAQGQGSEYVNSIIPGVSYTVPTDRVNYNNPNPAPAPGPAEYALSITPYVDDEPVGETLYFGTPQITITREDWDNWGFGEPDEEYYGTFLTPDGGEDYFNLINQIDGDVSEGNEIKVWGPCTIGFEDQPYEDTDWWVGRNQDYAIFFYTEG